jgi:amidase
VTTFILRLDTARHPGVRVAVKDLLDLAGTPTTAGCRAVADGASVATDDAACLASIRAEEQAGRVRLVGKTNLHELAYGVTGINPWYGTPRNPLDPDLVPGGSSSGSAVAVGDGEADVALGTDTGGSIRIPAACCGIVGLKTTAGRIPLGGVRPLAPSLDTVGPMAADVAGVAMGMSLLEPGFVPLSNPPTTVGRLRLAADEDVDRALDRALWAAELDVIDVELPGWERATSAGMTILDAEAWASNAPLVTGHPDAVGADVSTRLASAARVTAEQVASARAAATRWRRELDEVLERVDVIALPTMRRLPPRLTDARSVSGSRVTMPVNLAGVPALAMPVPTGGHLPASLQIVGPAGGEAAVLAIALIVEAAAAAQS